MLDLAQRIGPRVADVAKQAWLLIVVPILAAFFLKDGLAFGEVLLSFVHSRPQREFLEGRAWRFESDASAIYTRPTDAGGIFIVAYIAFLESREFHMRWCLARRAA